MIFDKIQKYGFMVLAAALGVLLLVQTVRLHGSQLEAAAAKTTLANERAESIAAAVAKHEQFRNTEHKLGDQAAQSRKEVNDQVRSLTARNAALLERVRLATQGGARGAGLSGTAATAGDGEVAGRDPGTELLGSLGEADVHEASRADVIRLHLAACYREYDGAREALKKLGAE